MPPQLLSHDNRCTQSPSPQSVVKSDAFFGNDEPQQQQQEQQQQIPKVLSQEALMTKNVEVRPCIPLVQTVGLEPFIRTIVKQIDLQLVDKVVFDMNSQGFFYSWSDVFAVEKTYTACLGIARRLYTCHGFYHEPSRRLTYFVLEERNERTIGPAFDFQAMVFCHYNERKEVTKVVVQYDQLSFYLHCLGIIGFHRWMSANVLTPLAMIWIKPYMALWRAHPATFLVYLFSIPVAMLWYFCLRQEGTKAS